MIKSVTVLGANGTMGANISGIFASFGNAKVYMVSRNQEQSVFAKSRAFKSVKAESISDNLIPVDYSCLEDCVKNSDLIFECLAESLTVKSKVLKTISNYISEKTVVCSGTSGLSINTLADSLPEKYRKNFYGVHFFNPPYSMTLCEVIPNQHCISQNTTELKSYLRKVLFRTLVEVKDSPAFLGNRIGFQFINEALQYAEKYKDNGGIDYIDAILGSFTGRAMAPLVTSDFVGLDVHKAIVNNIFANTNDYANRSFLLPKFVDKLIDDGHMGRKTNGGLYRTINHDNGKKSHLVYDINTNTYRAILPYAFPFAEKMKMQISEGDYEEALKSLVYNHSQEAQICLSFLLRYIVYSLFAAKEIGDQIESADDVMATGFNWCPPLALFDALSSVSEVVSLMKERIPEICSQIDVDSLLSNVKTSRYDFRQFFKSGR